MEPINAFDLLGATPSDNVEKLQELYEDKELLTDDTASLANACLELKNPQKRIIHEIEFFCRTDFSDFRNLTSGSLQKTMTNNRIAEIFVKIGKWFETHTLRGDAARRNAEFNPVAFSFFDGKSLLNRINSARMTVRMPIVDDDAFEKALDELKENFVAASARYLESIQRTSLVNIFNLIVKINDFGSFFIDELMARYELITSEKMNDLEQDCRNCLGQIESICNAYNDPESVVLSERFENLIASFIDALQKWDAYAHPLQVNMHAHGGQHDTSARLLFDCRNKVIALCNNFQNAIAASMKAWNLAVGTFDFTSAKTINLQLRKKLPDATRFIDGLINLIDCLISTFAELEVDCEQLKKDRKDLLSLKASLSDSILTTIKNQQRVVDKREAEEVAGKIGRITHGVFAVISLIAMVVFFALRIPAAGVAFIFIATAFAICCIFYPDLEGKKVMTFLILTGCILAGVTASCTAALSRGANGKNNEVTLTKDNFREYFDLSSSCSVTKTGYDSSGMSYGVATYKFSIAPKSSFNYAANPDNPSSFTVVIGVNFSFMQSASATPSQHKITVTLEKSSGYEYSGTATYNVDSFQKYWLDGIYEVNTTIFV